MPPVHRLLITLDPWLKLLVVGGTLTYLIEVSTGSTQAATAHPAFWWIHGFIAVCFTIEYVLRWIDDAQDSYGWHYPHSPMGIIDLLAIAPFWIGTGLPLQSQHIVRALRVFQLLKFFRYSRSLQLVALGFYRAVPALRPLGFSMLVIGLFCSVAIFETEHPAQPDKFRNLFDALYFTMVTVATVGYGDLSPITTPGRITVMFTFVSALAVFAGILGVLGASFFKVMEEEIDPNIDPLEEFRKEREKHLTARAAVSPAKNL
jgi:voltage-gated potassium channel